MACDGSDSVDTGSLGNSSESGSHAWFPPDYCGDDPIYSYYDIEIDTSAKDYPVPYDEVSDWKRWWVKSMFTGIPDSLLDEENCNPSSKCNYDGCAEPTCQSVEYWVEQLDFNDGSEVDYYSFAEPRPDSSGDPGGSSGPSLIGTAISLAAKQAGGVYGSVASAAISSYFDQYNSSVVTLDKNHNDTYDEEEWYWDISIDSDETGKDTFPTETCASNGVQLKIDNNAIHQDLTYCIGTSSRYDIIYPAYGSNHCRCEWGGHTYTIKTTQKASNYCFFGTSSDD